MTAVATPAKACPITGICGNPYDTGTSLVGSGRPWSVCIGPEPCWGTRPCLDMRAAAASAHAAVYPEQSAFPAGHTHLCWTARQVYFTFLRRSTFLSIPKDGDIIGDIRGQQMLIPVNRTWTRCLIGIGLVACLQILCGCDYNMITGVVKGEQDTWSDPSQLVIQQSSIDFADSSTSQPMELVNNTGGDLACQTERRVWRRRRRLADPWSYNGPMFLRAERGDHLDCGSKNRSPGDMECGSRSDGWQYPQDRHGLHGRGSGCGEH